MSRSEFYFDFLFLFDKLLKIMNLQENKLDLNYINMS